MSQDVVQYEYVYNVMLEVSKYLDTAFVHPFNDAIKVDIVHYILLEILKLRMMPTRHCTEYL